MKCRHGYSPAACPDCNRGKPKSEAARAAARAAEARRRKIAELRALSITGPGGTLWAPPSPEDHSQLTLGG